MNTITLYPSNWLYNTWVIGFLRFLEEKKVLEEEVVNTWLKDNGSVEIDRSIFNKIDATKFYFEKNKNKDKKINIIGNNEYYPNYWQTVWDKTAFKEFVESLSSCKEEKNSCSFCTNGHFIEDNIINNLKRDYNFFPKFLEGVTNFNIRLNSLLGPSSGKFPNSFWNFNSSTKLCHLCGYILLHHHLVLNQLSDNSEFFINAPSFKVMYYLNKLVRELYKKEQMKQIREILAVSLIEMAIKLNIHLGIWTSMNIECVSKYKSTIDFFSLPYEIVQLLIDRKIASLLNDIGEFKILNMLLDGNFQKILEFAERVIKIAIKPVNLLNKTNVSFKNEKIKLSKNKENLCSFSFKIFNLYALITEKNKGGIV